RQVVHHHPDVPAREIRAMAPIDLRADRGEPALVVELQLASQYVLARLVIGDERFGARRRPLDGAPEASGSDQEQRILRVYATAGSETAAGVGHHDPETVRLDAHPLDEP